MSLSETEKKEHFTHTILEHFLAWLIRPPGGSAGIFCSVHPQVPRETHQEFTDVHSLSRTARSIHVTAHGMFTTCSLFRSKWAFAYFKTVITQKKKKLSTFCQREGVQRLWTSCRGHTVTQRRISSVINKLRTICGGTNVQHRCNPP